MNGLLFKASFALCKALHKAGPHAEKGVAYSGRKTPIIKIAKSRVNAKKKGKTK